MRHLTPVTIRAGDIQDQISLGNLKSGVWDVALKCDADLINVVFECEIPTSSSDHVMEILEITGRSVYEIYEMMTRQREGIGY